ncbi:hypothetical protein ACLOJK_006200 [Asimina triloba]
MAGLVGVSFFSVWLIPLVGISVLSVPLVPLVCPSISLIPFIGVSFFSVFLIPFVPPHLSIFENLVCRNLPCHRLPKTYHLLWICWRSLVDFESLFVETLPSSTVRSP